MSNFFQEAMNSILCEIKVLKNDIKKSVNNLVGVKFNSEVITDDVKTLHFIGDCIEVSELDEEVVVQVLCPEAPEFVETVTYLSNTIAGHKIGDYTNENGTVVDIDETITTLVDNENGTYTYTSETGVQTVITIPEPVEFEETVTTIQNTVEGHKIGDYINEAAATVDINETVTALTDNEDGTATYINEDGDEVTISLGNTYTPQNGLEFRQSPLADDIIELGGLGLHDTTNTWVDYTWTNTWNSLTEIGLHLISTSTDATGSNQKLLSVNTSGVNANVGETTRGIYVSNTHTGSAAINHGVYSQVNGGASNYGVYGRISGTGNGAGVAGLTLINDTNGVEGAALGSGGQAGLFQAYGSNSFGGNIYSALYIGLHVQGRTLGARIFTEASTNNDIQPILQLSRTSVAGTGANGIGGSIEFRNPSSVGGLVLTDKIASKFVNVTTGISALEFSTMTSSTLARKMEIAGNGQITFDIYGDGVFANTPTYILGVLADGKVIEVDPESLGGGGGDTYTTDNGMTASTATNFQWGGTLLHDTTITSGTYRSTFTGSGVRTVHIINTDNTNIPLYITGQTAEAIHVESLGHQFLGRTTTSLNSNADTVFTIIRNSNTTATTNFGVDVEFDLSSATIDDRLASKIRTKWTDALDASRTAQFEIHTTTNTVTNRKLAIAGTGQLIADFYGDGTFEDTPVYLLGTLADGSIIEVDPESLGGGGGVYTVDNALNENTPGNFQLGGPWAIDDTVVGSYAEMYTEWYKDSSSTAIYNGTQAPDGTCSTNVNFEADNGGYAYVNLKSISTGSFAETYHESETDAGDSEGYSWSQFTSRVTNSTVGNQAVIARMDVYSEVDTGASNVYIEFTQTAPENGSYTAKIPSPSEAPAVAGLGTAYLTLSATVNGGAKIFADNEGNIDLGTIGGGDAVLFQTNTVDNDSQTLLNLIAGTGITLSETGGAVTIDSVIDWHILGNSGTVEGTNFLGTTDNIPLQFRVNNTHSGKIGKGTVTSIGFRANAADTSTNSNNTAMGYDSLRNTTGANNTGFGYNALLTNTSGTTNSAFGVNALRTSSTNSGNSGFGYNSLYSNEANNNSAFGYSSLAFNTSGTENSAFGYNALLNNLGGSGNSAFGYRALQANASGVYNVAIGNNALAANTGNNNVAVGRDALVGNIGGAGNIGIGTETLRANSSGTENTAVGFNAMWSNTTSGYNTAIGGKAMLLSDGSYYSVAVGYQAGVNSAGSNNTFVGFNSGYGDDFSYSGYNNASLGYEALHYITTGHDIVAIGSGAAEANRAGSNNVSVGSFALRNILASDDNIGIGTNAGYYNNNATNLVNNGSWTSTGWTAGGNAYTWTHNTGNTTSLTHSFTPSAGKIYNIGFVISGRTAGTVDISFAGLSLTGIASNLTFGWNQAEDVTTSTGILTITPSSTFDGTIEVTLIDNLNTASVDSIFIGSDSKALNATSSNEIVLGTGAIGRGSNTATYGNSSITSSKVFGVLNIASYTPSATGDTAGIQGDITWDDSYVYVKTSAGWKRSALSTF
jgi:hypothetical protein